MPSASYAAKEIDLTIGKVNPTSTQGWHPRSPVLVPSISLEGHTLLLMSGVNSDAVITFMDENGDEAFSTVAPIGTPTVTLPSTLSGTYELRLYPDGSSIYFYGDITL